MGHRKLYDLTYLEELRRKGVCAIQPAVNQHLGGQIEIGDAFWPYQKSRPSARTDILPGYVEQIRRLLCARSCIRSPLSSADERLASSLFERNVSLELVEHAVLLGCARKYVTLINHQSADAIVSLSYFEKIIAEVQELNVPEEYWQHLQMRVTQFEQHWDKMSPAGKNGPSTPPALTGPRP